MKDKISKRIILHLVPPKNGTTTLQIFRDPAHDALLEYGSRYADGGRIRNGQTLSLRRANIIDETSGPGKAEYLRSRTMIGTIDGLDADDGRQPLLAGITTCAHHGRLSGGEAFSCLTCEQVETGSMRSPCVLRAKTHVQ